MAKASDVFLKRSRSQHAQAWMNLRGVRFLLASAMNDVYQKAVSYPGHDGDEDYYRKLVAKHIIIDWKDLDNEDGTPMECTMENKIKLLSDYVEIGSRILTFASSPVNFLESNNIEEEIKN